MSAPTPPRARSGKARRGHDRDETDYGHRDHVNLVAVAFLLIVAIVLVWTVREFIESERLSACLASGRRNCIPIDQPPRTTLFVPSR